MKFFSKKIVLPSLALATAVALLPSCNNGGGGKGSGSGSTPSDGPVNPPPSGGGDTPTPHTNKQRETRKGPPDEGSLSGKVNPNKNTANHVNQKNYASGLTSIYQYGYGVYMVVMTPSDLSGMVSSFYLYDNMADLKSYFLCSGSVTKDNIGNYTGYGSDKYGRVTTWYADSDDDGNKVSDGTSIPTLGTSSVQKFADVIGKITDGKTKTAQCGWPSYWHEIDFEFVPGFSTDSDTPKSLRPVIDGGTCLNKSNCTLKNSFGDGKNYISFNTFNMDETIDFNVKYPLLQGNQQSTTDNQYYRSYNVIPNYMDKDNNSNLNAFYASENTLSSAPKLYVIYYTPSGIYWSKDSDPSKFDGTTLPSLPSPVFVKNNDDNSLDISDDISYDKLDAKDVIFRYNARAFNQSPTDESQFTTSLTDNTQLNLPEIIKNILANNNNLHAKYDGKYTSAKMNISLNLWDGTSQEDGFWGGKNKPTGEAQAKYIKIAYYPIKKEKLDAIKDAQSAIDPNNYESNPLFYSDFKNGEYYINGDLTNKKTFKDLWAVTDDTNFKWPIADTPLTQNVYLFSNRYIHPLGQFHSGLISCQTGEGLTLKSTPPSSGTPKSDTIQKCYTTTP